MTKIADVLPASYLKKWFKNPKAVNSKANMPNFKMTDEEIDNLIAFLLGILIQDFFLMGKERVAGLGG